MGILYTVNDLMQRYNIGRAAMIEYVKSKEEKINQDGIHMEKRGKEWHFDEEAVRIIDELRYRGIVNINTSAEATKIAELEKEINSLKTSLLMSQREIMVHKDKIIGLVEEANKNTKLLGAAESDLKVAELQHELLQKEIENLKTGKENETQRAEENAKLFNAAEADLKIIEGDNIKQKAENIILQEEIRTLREKLKETEEALKSEKEKSLFQKIFG